MCICSVELLHHVQQIVIIQSLQIILRLFTIAANLYANHFDCQLSQTCVDYFTDDNEQVKRAVRMNWHLCLEVNIVLVSCVFERRVRSQSCESEYFFAHSATFEMFEAKVKC